MNSIFFLKLVLERKEDAFASIHSIDTAKIYHTNGSYGSFVCNYVNGDKRVEDKLAHANGVMLHFLGNPTRMYNWWDILLTLIGVNVPVSNKTKTINYWVG